MCPNCILNQASLGSGLWVAFGICALFFIVGAVGVLWAFRNGEFEDLEEVKFDMLDDDLDGSLGARARSRSEAARVQTSGQ